jgi:hypothetical protein
MPQLQLLIFFQSNFFGGDFFKKNIEYSIKKNPQFFYKKIMFPHIVQAIQTNS